MAAAAKNGFLEFGASPNGPTVQREAFSNTDVANAFVMAAESDLSNEIWNIGSGNTYSINRLVELLGGDMVHIPKRPGEPDCTWADISKIRRLLGWNPIVSFDDGVRTMLKHIDYWNDAPLWTPETIKEATNDWFKYLSR